MNRAPRPRRWPLLLAAPALLPALLAVLDRSCPPDLSRVSVLGSRVLDRHGQVVAELPAAGGVWRLRTAPSDVSPVFLRLLLATEDRRFGAHGGIDLMALARAAGQWATHGHEVSGGSTLSMQAARLLEPRPRTLRSKLIEMFRATQLEERLGKTGVLTVWLTLAPFGGNLEGVEAGARAWFGIGAAQLDHAQSALLVAIPRRPEALRPDRHPGRARALRDRLLDDAIGRAAPLPSVRLLFPAHALQAVSRLPRAPEMRTTLDLATQVGLEALLARTLDGRPDRLGAAALVAEIGSRQLLAVASSRGALDLTQSVRSPGSALKPMLYGLAFQDGLCRPDTVLSDLPRHFGRYAPENFDRRFTAPVSAADALRRSLNMPAVTLLDRIGPARFLAWLAGAGLTVHLPPGAGASLPLALGGGGIRMRELAALYAALAGDGTVEPLSLQPAVPEPRESGSPDMRLPGRQLPGMELPGTPSPDARAAARPLLQAAAARLVADVLLRPLPDGGPDGVAWKTGTSWGGRDAWAFGFDAAHVGAVWIGRPDGTAIAGDTGHDTALPVLSQMLALLPPAPRSPSTETLAGSGAPIAVTVEDPLRILFPPPGVELSADGPVPLRVMGGRRPIAFLVDGAVLPSRPVARATNWVPPGAGFYTVSVIDADGISDRVRVRVR